MDLQAAMAVGTLACALLLDRFYAEYPATLHPVVWIGKLVSLLLKLAPRQGWWRQFAFGVVLAVVTTTVAVATAMAILRVADAFWWTTVLAGAYLLKASFALRELGAAAARVRDAVAAGDLPRAREALRSLCSRDPTHLEAEELLAAAVESLAENASDSFVAPLFYFALFGIPGAIAYRAINTLDAMVGYRGPFEALGKASARLDDLANFVPARLTALLLLVAGAMSGGSVKGGLRIFWRDRGKTPSPNSGQPMAMMAGLLGVQLEKKNEYFLGDRITSIEPMTVRRAGHLVSQTGCMAAGLCILGIVGVGFLVPFVMHSL